MLWLADDAPRRKLYSLGIAGVLAGLILVWRFAEARSESPILIFLVVPLAIVGICCGARAGALAAAVCIGIYTVRVAATQTTRGAVDFATRVVGFMVAGALLGLLSDASREFRRRSERDHLTGLANRRRFFQELERVLFERQRYGGGGAVLVLDVDGFKRVNDRYGHHAGDRLLRLVADALGQRLRKTDLLARVGGDEFAILLPHGNRDEADTVARTIRDVVNAIGLHFQGGAVPVSASVGVAMLDGDAERAMHEADRAMYEDKRTRR